MLTSGYTLVKYCLPIRAARELSWRLAVTEQDTYLGRASRCCLGGCGCILIGVRWLCARRAFVGIY